MRREAGKHVVSTDEAYWLCTTAFNRGSYGVAYGVAVLLRESLAVATQLRREQIATVCAIEEESRRRLTT